MGDQVLVTGGTGFIARWCIAQLLDRGYSVRTTVRDVSRADVVRAAISQVADTGRLSFVGCDLTSDDGWADAVEDCRFVVHPASPLGSKGGPGSLVAAARDGSVRVLAAAISAGAERIVLTSAANAASPTSYREPGVTDETLWTDPEAAGLDEYRRSKTLAERAAWAFLRDHAGSTTLTTILPGAVFGPILGTDNLGTVQVIGRLVRGEMDRVPRIGFEVVDVRDIADIHIRAMTTPAAAGERFLATGELMWLPDIARTLHHALGADGSRVPTRSVPDVAIRFLAKRRPELAAVVPALGRRNVHTTAKAKALLGWVPRPGAEVVLDCARSLVENRVA
jgi:dihydroflavonol-4-reductase